jgi:hypothetical protein
MKKKEAAALSATLQRSGTFQKWVQTFKISMLPNQNMRHNFFFKHMAVNLNYSYHKMREIANIYRFFNVKFMVRSGWQNRAGYRGYPQYRGTGARYHAGSQIRLPYPYPQNP